MPIPSASPKPSGPTGEDRVSETTLEIDRSETHRDAARGLARPARRAVHARLRRLHEGELTLVEAGERFRFGSPGARPRATVFVRDPAFYAALALRGSLGGAEAFVDGCWSTDDLAALIRILARNRETLTGFDGGLARWMRPPLRAWHRLRRNTRAGSRRNIAAHYDLGNEFFELFLDPTLSYSSGIFERADASMEEASVAKFERVCRKLEIGPADHVLEIGSGWGGFAIHAARETRMPRHDDDHLPTPARAGPPAGARKRGSKTGSACCTKTTAT